MNTNIIKENIIHHETWISTQHREGKPLILENVDLSHLYFSGVNLRGAKIINSNLNCVILRNSNLRSTIIKDSDLSNADLRNSDLRGANLTGCNLTGARLNGCDMRETILPEGCFSLSYGKYSLLYVNNHSLLMNGQLYTLDEWYRIDGITTELKLLIKQMTDLKSPHSL